MNADAEAWMMVRAAQEALEAAQDELTKRLDALRDEWGIRGGFNTSRGAIIAVHKDVEIFYPRQSALVEFARAEYPHEVVDAWDETVHHEDAVRSSLKETLKERFKISGDEVIDSKTGEVVEWAKVRPASDTWRKDLTEEAKEQAKTAILGAVGSGQLLALPQEGPDAP